MKLTEISPKASYEKMNKVFETRFGFTVDFKNLSTNKAQNMLETLNRKLNDIRQSHKIHGAQKSPEFAEMLTLSEALRDFVQRRKRVISESETDQAEVRLAAKDMTDRLQDMIETISKMQHEELQPLVDAIRDEMDPASADAFQMSAQTALSTALDSVTQARGEMDSANRVLYGEEGVPMGMDDPMGGDEFGAPDMGGDPMGGDLGLDDPMAGDDLGMDMAPEAPDAAIGGPEELGREERF